MDNEITLLQLSDLSDPPLEITHIHLIEQEKKKSFEKGYQKGKKEVIDEFDEKKRSQEKLIELEKKRGYQIGYDAGYEEGLKAGSKEGKEFLKTIHEKLSGIDTEIRNLDEWLSSAILELVSMLVKKIVFGNIGDKDAILALIKESLRSLSSPRNAQDPIYIFLNPQDLKVINDYIKHLSINGELIFQGKSSIDRGGCELIFKDLLVDGTLHNRLEKVLSTVHIPLSF